MSKVTSRERMLKAMRNQQPDRIPVAPDMSNMIPCRHTGKPFWLDMAAIDREVGKLS